MAANLAGTKTHENLKAAFAGESQANRRYLYFAKNADVEGHPDLAGLFRRHRGVARPATRTATWTSSSRSAIPRPASRSATRARTSRPPIAGEDLREYTGDVPRLRPHRARRGLRGSGRVVRDARPRREVARRSLPEGPRQPVVVRRMSKLTPIIRRDVMGPALYGPIRDDFRRRIMDLKKHRRVHVGDRVTLVFENRDTLLFQIEEMLRAGGRSPRTRGSSRSWTSTTRSCPTRARCRRRCSWRSRATRDAKQLPLPRFDRHRRARELAPHR